MGHFISIVLPVKNGLPHLRDAIDALRAQTYRNFEVLIEDGASTDGSLDYIRSLRDIPNLSVASAPDTGVGQAFNRGLLRCRGDLVCFASADEKLEPDALEKGIRWFERRPDAVCANGAVHLVDAQDCVVQRFQTPRFDLLRHLSNEVVLPFAGFLNRRRIGDDLLRYDESLKTCPDYDFWIRLGTHFSPTDFAVFHELFKTARADAASMSFRPESFDQFCRDKVFILNRYLDTQPASPVVEALRRNAIGGIYLWAAESLLGIEGVSHGFMRWCAAASSLAPWSPRLERLATVSQAFRLDDVNGVIIPVDDWQPSRPPAPQSPHVKLSLDPFVDPSWETTWAKHEGGHVSITTSPRPWQRSAGVRLGLPLALDPDLWHWVRVTVAVDAGGVGIGLSSDTDLGERVVTGPRPPTEVWLPVMTRDATMWIRNADRPEPSTVRLLDAYLESCPRTDPL